LNTLSVSTRLVACIVSLGALAGCKPSYSPDTYASNAVQQANKAEQGVVVGVRDVEVSASGTVGAVTGGAAGGIAGSQVGAGPLSAFTALGGSLIGGLAGTAAEHAAGDTKAFEYIVRKGNGDLVSVTQKDVTPLALGQKVLVIAGNQARVVPDYTVNLTPSDKQKAAEAKDHPTDTAKPDDSKPAGPSADGVVPADTKPVDAAQVPPATVPPAPIQPGDPAAQPATSAPIRLTDPLPASQDPPKPQSGP
jgi:outer membrane lipoprotein SlyB